MKFGSSSSFAALSSSLPHLSWRRAVLPLVGSAVVSAALTHATVAHAAVTHAGTWPEQEKPVSVDIHGANRATALTELADAAGWSLVVRDAAAPGPAIDLHIVKQPPSKVLDLILDDVPGTYTATRDGSIVSLSFAPGHTGANGGSASFPAFQAIPAIPAIPAMPAPPEPPAPPALNIDAGELAKLGEGHARGDDRTVTGGSLRIEKGETVHNVSVFGGNLEVLGTVTGNISVLGGSAHLHDGAHVDGSANILGGSVKLDDGVVIDGDVGILGGSVKRAPGAVIHGSVEGLDDDDDDDEGDAADQASRHQHHAHAEHEKHASDEAQEAGFSVSAAALLFVFGALFLAFGPRRVDRLRAELIARPVRSIFVGGLAFLALSLLAVILCCTIVGIPVALLLLVGTPVVMLLGSCVILTTVGGALLQHRSTNPNVHLAAGCALFFLVGLIPVVGDIMRFLLALAGLGIMIATRGAGLIKPAAGAPPSTGMPYR